MQINSIFLGPDAPLLFDGDFAYRDLNKNGRLDPYEDSRLSVNERVADLLGQMTVAEKVGMMFHTILGMGQDGNLLDEPTPLNPQPTTELVAGKLINHFNVHQAAPPRQMAEWVNRLQKLAERTRLGIPVTLSTDPRHAYSHNPGASFVAGHFSQWPEPIGLAAIGDEDLVRTFGDMARQEYIAVGIRAALHPMADLATEPRWARMNGTFGEDAQLAARLTAAYIRGFQGETLGPESVACMTKHFPGGGPQKDGEDPHFSTGKEQIYPGGYFDYHLIPFEAAFAAGTAQIMPYYGMPVGAGVEEVGFGFNKEIITGLLRQRYGFDGVVCTDWRLLTPVMAGDKVIIDAKCWGVEHLSVHERILKALDAGVDQFGGESCPEYVIELVAGGQLAEARLDESVRRLLRDKFRLGLFDNPYLNPELAGQVVGNARFRAAGADAQRRSIVLLKNGRDGAGPTLPLSGRPRLYVENMDVGAVNRDGEMVSTVEEADFAILRLSTPYEPREGFLERFFHSGDLDFKGEELARILDICARVPTIVDIYLERGAVIPEIAAACAGLLGNFGVSDDALLDVLFGRVNPGGRLPFELPSSMTAVRQQHPDAPHDSANPLFPMGYGLRYS